MRRRGADRTRRSNMHVLLMISCTDRLPSAAGLVGKGGGQAIARGISQTQSRNQRRQDPDGQPIKGESCGFLGFEYRLIRSRQGKWRTQLVPKMKKRTALLSKAQAHLPTVQEPTCRAGDRRDQSNPARMGELLRGRTLEPVLLVHQAMGGEEGSAASDARPGTTGIRLEAVEYDVAP